MKSTILLSPTDNVLVLTQSLPAGSKIEVQGATYTLPVSLGLGHKIAACHLNHGDKILKYGVPIGSATTAIQRGEHIHLHNMKSDYLPTYTLDSAHQYH